MENYISNYNYAKLEQDGEDYANYTRFARRIS